VAPVLAHGFQGPAGGVSSIMYLVAAVSAFVSLEARDRRQSAQNPAALNRRVRVSATVCALAMLLGVTALWWVPGARKHDKKKPKTATAATAARRPH
jgi:hypothetical protein